MLYYDKQLCRLTDKTEIRKAICDELEKRAPAIKRKLNRAEREEIMLLALYALNRFTVLEAPGKI